MPTSPSSAAAATSRPRAVPYAGAAVKRSRRKLGWAVLGGAAGSALALLLFTQAARRPDFDKDRAFQSLEKQVAFGPRVPGMRGHAQCLDYIVESLRPLADSVEKQSFRMTLDGRALMMTNVVARWKGSSTRPGVLLSAHWDTRPTADQEQDPVRAATPIPGANDGASGVAVLLESARALKQSPPPVPVMMVFFDGEDYGPGLDRMFLGARYFADHLPADVPKKGVLLDMIGDRDLRVPREPNSVQNAREVVDEVYGVARQLGLDTHFPPVGTGIPIEDDHLPLQRKGLKIIDLIDFDYGPGNSFWHTLDDTPDKCSATSLKMVGDVVLTWVYGTR
jgi:glutaminyl-peptide cyclotransferase